MQTLVYIDPVFLDATVCARVRQGMDAGVAEEAEILDQAMERRDDIRRAVSVDVEAGLIDEVEGRLESRRADIARFFGVGLGDREGASFLRYPPGGFYAPHRDRADLPSWPG